MILSPKRALVYLGTTERVSQKTGEVFELIKLADPSKYENYDFFKSQQLDTTQLTEGEQVICTFEAQKRGFNLNLNLTSVMKAK